MAMLKAKPIILSVYISMDFGDEMIDLSCYLYVHFIIYQDLVSKSSQNTPQSSSITSPSDIYRAFMQSSQQPRSILKQTKQGDDTQTDGQEMGRSVHFDPAETEQKPDKKIEAPPTVNLTEKMILAYKMLKGRVVLFPIGIANYDD